MSGILVLQRRGSYEDLPTEVFPPSLLTAAHTEEAVDRPDYKMLLLDTNFHMVR